MKDDVLEDFSAFQSDMIVQFTEATTRQSIICIILSLTNFLITKQNVKFHFRSQIRRVHVPQAVVDDHHAEGENQQNAT